MEVYEFVLTDKEMQDWQASKPDEYQEYVDAGWLNTETGELYEVPDWMIDGDPTNGPFDFKLNPSHGTIGW